MGLCGDARKTEYLQTSIRWYVAGEQCSCGICVYVGAIVGYGALDDDGPGRGVSTQGLLEVGCCCSGSSFLFAGKDAELCGPSRNLTMPFVQHTKYST